MGGPASTSNLVDVVVVRRSTVVTASPLSTNSDGAFPGSASSGSASSGSTSGGSGILTASPRQLTTHHAAARKIVRTRIAWRPEPPTCRPLESIRSPVMRLLSIVLLFSLTACSRVNSGRPTEYPVIPGAGLGTGISSLSGTSAGQCVESRSASTQPRVEGLTEQVVYARDKVELLRTLGISSGLSFGIFGVGVNASAESIDTISHSRSTSFIVIDIRVKTASTQLRRYQLTEDARETLRREGAAKFYEMCGDGFVAEVQRGGSFLGIVALENVSRTEANKLSGQAGLSFLGVGGHGGASRERTEFMESHRARYYVVQVGGTAGAVGSLKPENSIEALVDRADRFKSSVTSRSAPIRLVVKPYETASNRPPRDLWDLTEERRFLEQLVRHRDELHHADDEIVAQLDLHTCTRDKDHNRLERQHSAYTESLAAIQRRAEDCVREPNKHCRDKGLDFLNPNQHNKLLALCPAAAATPRGGTLGMMARPAPPPRPGVDAPCRTWRFESLAVEVAPSKRGGAPWDGDGSPPDITVSLRLGERRTALPKRSGYTSSGPIVNGLVDAGTSTRAIVTDSDAFFDDPVADLVANVPETLEDNAWTLSDGRTSLLLKGRCIE